MPSSAQHPTSRIFPTFIGIFLIVIGAVFVWLMGRSFLRALEIRNNWQKTPCTIATSSIEERRLDPASMPEFRADLAYNYSFQGEPHTGEKITLRGNPWSSDRKKIEKQLAPYPPASRTICYVDPAHPDTAVLKPDSLAPGYSIWFPALFVVGGAGLIIGVWRKPKTVNFS